MKITSPMQNIIQKKNSTINKIFTQHPSYPSSQTHLPTKDHIFVNETQNFKILPNQSFPFKTSSWTETHHGTPLEHPIEKYLANVCISQSTKKGPKILFQDRHRLVTENKVNFKMQFAPGIHSFGTTCSIMLFRETQSGPRSVKFGSGSKDKMNIQDCVLPIFTECVSNDLNSDLNSKGVFSAEEELYLIEANLPKCNNDREKFCWIIALQNYQGGILSWKSDLFVCSNKKDSKKSAKRNQECQEIPCKKLKVESLASHSKFPSFESFMSLLESKNSIENPNDNDVFLCTSQEISNSWPPFDNSLVKLDEEQVFSSDPIQTDLFEDFVTSPSLF